MKAIFPKRTEVRVQMFVLCLMVLLFSGQGFAGDLHLQPVAGEIKLNEGRSIIYNQAIAIGEGRVLFEKPVLVDGDTQARVKGRGRYGSIYNIATMWAGHYGKAFCKAIGMKAGVVTDNAFPGTDLVAEFDSNGRLTAVGKPSTEAVISYVVCEKYPDQRIHLGVLTF